MKNPKQYVRLTFVANGGLTKRTVWARKGKIDVRRGIATYWVVNREGEDVNPHELVIAEIGEAKEKPAVMNNLYGELEVRV